MNLYIYLVVTSIILHTILVSHFSLKQSLLSGFPRKIDDYRKNYREYKSSIKSLYQSVHGVAQIVDDNIKYIRNVGSTFERDRKTNIEVYVSILAEILKMQEYSYTLRFCRIMFLYYLSMLFQVKFANICRNSLNMIRKFRISLI